MPRLIPLGLLLAAAVAGEDGAAKRHEEAVRRFLAPGGKGTFKFVGDMFADGKRVGHCSYTAEPDRLPGDKGAKDHWLVQDGIYYTAGDARMGLEAKAYLARDLRAVRGKTDTHGPRRSVLWYRVGEQYKSRHVAVDGTLSERTTAAEPYRTTTTAGALLFIRLAWPLEGRFSAARLTLDSGEAPADEHVWSYQGPATWCGKKALIVACRIGGERMTVALQPDSREALGVAMHLKKGTIWCLRENRGLVAPVSDPLKDLPERAANSPVEAAAQAWLFVAGRDRSLGERCIHWPTVYAALRKAHPDNALALEDFRKGFLDGIAALGPAPEFAAMRERILADLPDAIVRMQDARRATVTLPGAVPLEVGEFDGAWHWLELPPK